MEIIREHIFVSRGILLKYIKILFFKEVKKEAGIFQFKKWLRTTVLEAVTVA